MFLRELLTLRRMTMQELADKIGVSKMTISYYCSGERTPNPDTLNKIANIMGVDLDTLVNGKPLEEITDDDALKELISLCNSLNKKGKDKVISYINDLSKRYFK